MDSYLDILCDNIFLDRNLASNISVFVSGAEHTGTSWCAFETAHILNKKKKNVLFVDGNGNYSNISTHLLFNAKGFLSEYISGKKTLNQIVSPYKNKNFNILSATPNSNYLSEQPIGRVKIFADDLKTISTQHDQVIIDMGTNLNTKTLNLCQLADNLIFVCSEDNNDLIKTFDLIKFVYETGLNANYYLIINKVLSFEDGYKVYEKLNKATERNGLVCPELLGIIRADTRIRDTIKNKESMLSRYPEAEAIADLYNISKRLYRF